MHAQLAASHEDHGDEEERQAEGQGPQELAPPKLRQQGVGPVWGSQPLVHVLQALNPRLCPPCSRYHSPHMNSEQ